MAERKENFALIFKMRTPLALEYVKFLNRYNIQTVLGVTNSGQIIWIFADEDEYLRLTDVSEHFNKEEEQIKELLRVIGKLLDVSYYVLQEEQEEDEYE